MAERYLAENLGDAGRRTSTSSHCGHGRTQREVPHAVATDGFRLDWFCFVSVEASGGVIFAAGGRISS
ncbi:hypothetical protein [Dactylosporangium sp. NPDC000521]|uniref:hypothetical protein n=1 Tax=Dactylosporangium sp. NPDC000521 TaxID=3363975 RepID=UPI0036A8E4EC